jgi:protein O-mannosyl-transferase
MTRALHGPSLAILAALILVAAIYAPAAGYDLVMYDDSWLVRDNWICSEPSLAALHAIWFDGSALTRFALGAEYLPVRDLSTMLDFVVWGTWFGGHHLTSIALYAGAVCAWFAALAALGLERRIAALAALLWAIHPAHAESVAWLAERKGVLSALFAALAVLGYARFRRAEGRALGWLALGAVAAAAAVWSKAPAAFAIAALAPLELVLPERRSWRRSLLGLGVIGGVVAAAFVPVMWVAMQAQVIGGDDAAPAGWAAMAIGVHGFYLRLAALAVPNAVSYPIATDGPSVLDLAVGGIGLVAILAVAIAGGRVGTSSTIRALRVAAILWLAAWFPISRLVLPLNAVLVADRYLLLPTLGVAIALAAGLARIRKPLLRRIAIGAVVVASTARALDAQGTSRSPAYLWERAVASNPADGQAWAAYAEALVEAGRLPDAFGVVREGLTHSRAPRLLLRKALLVVQLGDRPDALRTMRDAATAGEPRAMSNLALMLLDEGPAAHAEALRWAERGAALQPMYAPGHRALGKVALAGGELAIALPAFERAVGLEPRSAANRYNLALVLLRLGRKDEARDQLNRCLDDPRIEPLARAQLQGL